MAMAVATMAGATGLDGNGRIYVRLHIVDIGRFEFCRSAGLRVFVQ